MIDNKKELVVKGNRLIEARYRLTLGEQRLLLFAIIEARKNKILITTDTLITIKATEYAAAFNIPAKQSYEQLKDSALELYRREVFLYDTHPETGKTRTIPTRWVESIPYIDGAGIIQLRFTATIIPLITQLENNFTEYKLEKIAGMSSPYAIRLYELLMQWGQKGSREIELKWLKDKLVLESEYKELYDLEKRVLKVATEQINQHSDLTCNYIKRKTGRNVTHLTFNFDRKPEATAATEPKTKPAIKRATKPTVQSAAPNPTGTSKEVKQALRELLAARKKITPPEIKTKPEPPPATSFPARSLASIMNEIVPTLQRGNDQALAPGF